MTTTGTQAAVAGSTGLPRRVPGRRAWLLAWLAFLPLAVLRAGLLVEGDTFVQIRTGLLIMAQHAIPRADTLSWTMYGKLYFQNSWAFDVLLAVSYRVGGLPAAALLCALITMGIAALVMTLARSLGASPAAAAVALFLAAPVLAGWLTARPQLADYAAVLALTLLLRSIEYERGRFGSVALAALLTIAWINLHAAALLGVVIAAAGAVLVAFMRRGTVWRYVAAAAAAMAVACVANPYGLGVLHQTVQVRDAAAASTVGEWLPPDWANPLLDVAMAGGVAALIIAWRRREAVLTAALAVCLAGSAEAWRILPVMLVLAAPVLAAFASDPPDLIRRYLVSRRTMLQRCGALAMAALVAVAAPSLTHIGRPEPDAYPIGLVPDLPNGCRLFSNDTIGSYVTLARPDVLVSLDTRNNLYGKALTMAEARVWYGSGNLARGLAGASCVLVPRKYRLARRLRDDPEWQERAADHIAILYVRR